MDFLQAAAIALISGGLVSFIEFLIRRNDAKNDKNSEVLKAIKELADKIAMCRMDLHAVNTGFLCNDRTGDEFFHHAFDFFG